MGDAEGAEIELRGTVLRAHAAGDWCVVVARLDDGREVTLHNPVPRGLPWMAAAGFPEGSRVRVNADCTVCLPA